jgi:hypothetical protein
MLASRAETGILDVGNQDGPFHKERLLRSISFEL